MGPGRDFSRWDGPGSSLSYPGRDREIAARDGISRAYSIIVKDSNLAYCHGYFKCIYQSITILKILSGGSLNNNNRINGCRGKQTENNRTKEIVGVNNIYFTF
jgi:hypothetical protein